MHLFLKIFGYSVSMLAFLMGLALIFGNFFPTIPFRFRITLGIVLLLYSVYRFLMARMEREKTI